MLNTHINTKFRRARGYGHMLRAIAKAGGAASCFTPERLKHMTAMELMETLGNNNVFCKYVKFENKPRKTRKVNKTMPIIINTEKVWKDGQQCRKILNFEALTFEQIPEEYYNKKTEPYCFNNKKRKRLEIWATSDVGMFYYIRADDIIKEETFQAILKLVRKAGDRLMKINKRLAKERAKQWSGKQKFTI